MGWRRRLFHPQLCGGFPSRSPGGTKRALSGAKPRGHGWAAGLGRREKGGTAGGGGEAEVFLGPRETCEGLPCQGRGASANTTLQIFMLGGQKKNKPQKHKKNTTTTTNPTTLLCHSAGQIQPLCEMTTLIAKADYRNAVAGLALAACAAASGSGAFCCLRQGPGTFGVMGGGWQTRVAAPLPQIAFHFQRIPLPAARASPEQRRGGDPRQLGFVSAQKLINVTGGFLPSFRLSPINMSWICLPS